MKIRRIVLLLAALLVYQYGRAAKEWIDVTSQYITNPHYDGNSQQGWVLDGYANSTACDFNAQEFWNGWWDCYQMVTLPAGHYRVSVQGFYRPGANNNGAVQAYESNTWNATCVLYAGASEVPLKSVYSAYSEENVGWGCWEYRSGGWGSESRFYPNNMASASSFFENDQYWNNLEFDVEEGEDPRAIGIMNEEHVTSNWTMFTNWKLEYFGEMVHVLSVRFACTAMDMTVGDVKQLAVTIMPSDATVKQLLWTSSDESVAKVDQEGNITALSVGMAKIPAMSTDGSKRQATCTVTVEHNLPQPGTLLVNELMAANVDMFVDPSWNYGGWVELYNPTDAPVSLAGCWVSDDPEVLCKGLIHRNVGSVPAHGFRTLWFDHAETRKDVNEKWVNTQVDTKLKCEGGTLYISDAEGRILVEQSYPAAVMRCSYARKTDGGSEWSHSATPTPGTSNTGMTFADTQLPEPVVDKPGQLFSGNMNIKVTIPAGTTLRYTNDGSTPTLENGMTSQSGDFSFSSSRTFRFRLYKDGYLPSKVVTRSYIASDGEYYLPVISIVTDEANLYDDMIGIYVDGSNGKTANQDYTKRNFNMDWDRPASFEYIANGHEAGNVDGYFAQEVDIAINGGWSRKYYPRSLKVKSDKIYDLKNSLDYPFFADKPYNKHKSLLLRNGGNDEYNRTRLKDAALQQIARVSRFPLNLQSYQPVHLFINGYYMAMLNLREPSNKHYGYSNCGIDTDEIDAFEMSVDSGYVQKSGTKEAFLEWKSLSKNAGDELTYQQIGNLVDMDDFINYMAFKFYLNDWDWPHNNAKGFRDRNDGKFKFVVFDLDNCVDRTGNNIFNDFASKRTHTFYGRPEYGGSSITAEVELVTIFLNMLKNEDFKRRFIDTYCIVGGSVFGDEEEIADVVMGMADNIAPALAMEGSSPYGTGRSYAQGIINAVTGGFRQRMTNVIRSYATFGLNRTAAQQVKLSSNVKGASVSINGIQVPRCKFNGYLFAPVTLQAQTPAGYRFAGWWSESGGKSTASVFGKAEQWKYYDTGSLDGEDWTAEDYPANNGWSVGRAPFGYANSGKPMANAATQLARTDAAGSRIPTYYMRKEFTLDKSPEEGDVYSLDYELDDASIIYVNGVEVDVYHLWSGATYSQYCQDRGNGDWYEGDDPHQATVRIPAELLHKGKNVVAVEVHNCNSGSSDIWWDAELNVQRAVSSEGQYVSTDEEYVMPESGSFNLMARYEPLSDAEMMAANVTPVRINEVSAGNSVNVNDYYKKDDWVELYNTTDRDIDLAGMFLSDKKSNPHKYCIEGSNTIIPAHGFKVVWCSKRDATDREIHANFKLDNEDGKMVRIEAADGSWADSLVYCGHAGTQSVGRYPDGADEVYLMARTTILAHNVLDSQSDKWEFVPDGEQTSLDGLLADNAGGMHVRYRNGELVLTGAQGDEAVLRVYTMDGASRALRSLRLSAGSARVSVEGLAQGVYVARVTDVVGRECAVKFVVRR